MNLQTHIRLELWLAISNTYQAGNYSHAILDGMHYLSDVLRSKTNIDADGASLVGQALGGDSPRLRINKLQTETERSMQKGMEQILRGLYIGVRNPRSHGQIEDTQDTANSIIYFINYLLGLIDKSEEPFTLPSFLSRVFDPDFVESDRYAQLLVDEIPANKRVDTLIEIYRKKSDGEGAKLTYIVRAILSKLSDEQIPQFLAVVSDELKATQNELSIELALEMLPTELWPKISEAARLRIENKLIRSIEMGEIFLDGTVVGTLGIYTKDLIPYLTFKEQVGQTLLDKLEGNDPDDWRYVATHFTSTLPELVSHRYRITRFVRAISKAIREGETCVRRELLKHINSYPEEWQRKFAENLKDLTDADHPEYYLSDGTPFLTATVTDDDIPF